MTAPLGFLFPGQGARHVLAAVSLAREWPEGERLLALALEAVKLTHFELEAQGGRALERTEVLQPVLTAVCLAVHGALTRAGLRPALVLGHSLGEVPAAAAAGVITDEAAVQLAAQRGALMAREAAKHPGGLLALPSLEVARALLGHGLEIAALNAPDEVVLSGPEAAVRAIAAVTPARRVPVSGAWHSAAMRGAVEEFRTAVQALEQRQAVVPFIRNLDGALGHSLDSLADQLTQPVQFTAALATARAQGVDTFVTIGPGVVLRGLVRRNLGTTVRVWTTEDAADLSRTLTALAPSHDTNRA